MSGSSLQCNGGSSHLLPEAPQFKGRNKWRRCERRVVRRTETDYPISALLPRVLCSTKKAPPREVSRRLLLEGCYQTARPNLPRKGPNPPKPSERRWKRVGMAGKQCEEKAAAKTDALATIAPGHEDDPSGAELVKNRDAQDRWHK